ncbi:MAG: DUF1653 domain-containing protein [Clostridia bacterium]|nr:DUF1653 domain-containing protein [Clostridia bacterium]
MVKKGLYRHYKGNYYLLTGIATNSETLEKMVIYKALYGKCETWVRPLKMWEEKVEGASQNMRFMLLEKAKLEESCGVIIKRKNEGETEYLLLLQKGSKTWSFPKGHMKKRETKVQTAIRELKEETNLDVTKIDSHDYRCVSYRLKNRNVKCVYLFNAQYSGEIKLLESEIEDFKWVTREEALKLLPKVGYDKILK